MKKILLVLLVLGSLLLVQSCTTPRLTGNYSEKIYWAESEKTFSESFDKAVELFVDMGYELKGVNRENGIIQINLTLPTTKIWIEEKGKTPPSFAYIAIPEKSSRYTMVSAIITILVRNAGVRSVAGVKLVPIKFDGKGLTINSRVATTGVYEKELLNALIQPSTSTLIHK